MLVSILNREVDNYLKKKRRFAKRTKNNKINRIPFSVWDNLP